jgi:CRP-like cAMP-binding protein
MARAKEIDRDALHRVLWRRTDRRGALKFVQNQLALELGISAYHFSRIMAEFQEEGRVRQIAIGKHNVRTYTVSDPATWRELATAAS